MKLPGNEIYAGEHTKITFDEEYFYFFEFVNNTWQLVDQMHVSTFHFDWYSKLITEAVCRL